MHGWTKLQALQYCADSAIESSRVTKEILSDHSEACEIYTRVFLPELVEFHAAATKRYKLDDLDLAA